MQQQKTIENYLKVIYLLQRQNGYVYNIDIARYFNFSKATVTRAVQKLVEGNYITIGDEHKIFLTEIGENIAINTYTKYKTFIRILISLGVSKEIASRDACRLEHAVSKESFDAIASLLEFAESW